MIVTEAEKVKEDNGKQELVRASLTALVPLTKLASTLTKEVGRG